MSAALILGFLGKNWRLLALAAVALAVFGYVATNHLTIAHLRSEIVGYRAANAQLHAANQSEHTTVQDLLRVNAANQRVCAAAESAARTNITIAKHEAAQARVRAAHYGSILHAIQAAPASADGPVSPLLRDSVDSLWDQP